MWDFLLNGVTLAVAAVLGGLLAILLFTVLPTFFRPLAKMEKALRSPLSTHCLAVLPVSVSLNLA